MPCLKRKIELNSDYSLTLSVVITQTRLRSSRGMQLAMRMYVIIQRLNRSLLHFLGEFALRVRVRLHVRFSADRNAKRRFDPRLVEAWVSCSSVIW